MTTMRKLFLSTTGVGLATWLTMGVGLAQQPSTNDTGRQPMGGDTQQQQPSGTERQQPSGMQQQQRGGTPSSVVGEVMTATATVEKVNMDKHNVSLKDNEGNEFVVNVPEDVTRLDNVKKGDQVRVTYKQSLALSLKKGGEGAAAPSETQMRERAGGNLPGGMMGRQITTSAKITKIDPSANKLTVKTPDGTTDTINVSDPAMQADMKKLKVGDKIQATYTEAVAMSVTPKSKE